MQSLHDVYDEQGISNLHILSGFSALFLQSGVTLNCSEPTSNSLMVAFNQSVFKLAAVRPVKNLSTVTNVSIAFTLFGILGVVSKKLQIQ